MPLPAPLLRRKPNVHKNDFGHVLILAGSRQMMGAAALASLAAFRSGAGLVTLGIPQSLNTLAQKKVSNAVMTLPLAETRAQTLAPAAFKKIKDSYSAFNAIAIGPGLSRNPGTQSLIKKVVETSPVALIIDADALNALSRSLDSLTKTKTVKILTPHPGEMSRLVKKNKAYIDKYRKGVASSFAEKYHCIVLLKGHKTIVVSPNKKAYTNTSGNAGMATAGSGDVLSGMIAAFAAQGLSGFDAAKYGAYLHGKAGDLAAKDKTKAAMIASDIVDYIPAAIKKEAGREKPAPIRKTEWLRSLILPSFSDGGRMRKWKK
ncbi:MAG: NAD(P)H-hydrate dehydratase [Candidatus Omnitrophica bacterium]|nr:NAD(P)H-hydrate dehydratase [Candidatus Omnitrophota bacterium]